MKHVFTIKAGAGVWTLDIDGANVAQFIRRGDLVRCVKERASELNAANGVAIVRFA